MASKYPPFIGDEGEQDGRDPGNGLGRHRCHMDPVKEKIGDDVVDGGCQHAEDQISDPLPQRIAGSALFFAGIRTGAVFIGKCVCIHEASVNM